MNKPITSCPSGNMAKNIYRQILGGPQSDALLGEWTTRLILPLCKRKTLDTGVGNGESSKRLLNLQGDAPEVLTLSDYQSETVIKAAQKICSNYFGTTQIKHRKLDLKCAEDFLSVEDQYDLIICNSVLMHLEEEQVILAINCLAALVAPGGHLLVGTICGDLARKCYIPAPSLGKHKYFPRLKDVPAGATEADVPNEFCLLAENYPPNAFYDNVCRNARFGAARFNTTTFETIIGDECSGSIYEEFRGQALWRLNLMQRI